MVKKIEHVSEMRGALLLLVLLPIFLTLAPVLIGGKALDHADAIGLEYPIWGFFKRTVPDVQDTLWNPYNFSGFPSWANVIGGFFSPVNYLLYRFLPVFTAFHLFLFLHFVFGAYLAALLCRRLGVQNIFAAAVGGLVYVYGYLWFWLPDVSMASVAPLFPFLFLCLWDIAHEGKWRIVFGGGAIAGVLALSAHYQFLVEVLFVAGIFGIFLLLIEQAGKRLPTTIRFLVFFGMCLAIAAIQLIPVLVFAHFSARQGGYSFLRSAGEGLMPQSIIGYLFPALYKIGSFGLGAKIYIGVLPLFFLVLGVCVRRKDAIGRFFVFGFLLSVAASIAYSPLFGLIHFLPVFRLFYAPIRWMYVVQLFGGVLIAMALDRYRETLFSRPAHIIYTVFSWIGIVVGGGMIGAWFFAALFHKQILALLNRLFDAYWYARTLHLPHAYYYQYIAKWFHDITLQIDFLNPLVLFPIIFLFASMVWLRRVFRGGPHESIPAYVYGISALNFILVFLFFHPLVSRSLFYAEPGTVHWLRTHEPGRILPFLPAKTEFFKLTVPYGQNPPPDVSLAFELSLITPSNINNWYGIESVDYFDQLMSRRMARILAYIGGEHPTVPEDQLAYENISPEDAVRKLELRKNVLDFIGTRYVVSAYPFHEPGFHNVFEETVISPYHIPIAIYENRDLRPRFYFADAVEVIPEDELAAFEKLKTLLEKGKRVFIECPQGKDCSLFERTHFSGKGDIAVETKKNTVSVLQTKSDASQLLVFSENNLPGWKAYVDGVETPLYTVGSVYMGIAVPAGAHEIRFVFTYRNIMQEFLRMI